MPIPMIVIPLVKVALAKFGAAHALAALHGGAATAIHPLTGHVFHGLVTHTGSAASDAMASAPGAHTLVAAPLQLAGVHNAVGVASALAVGTASAVTVSKVAEIAILFAEGYTVRSATRELRERVDLRFVKAWFAGVDASADGTRLTAFGQLRSGRFHAADPKAPGPRVMLQAVLDPRTNELRHARIVRGVTSVSRSMLDSHRHDGIAVYSPAT